MIKIVSTNELPNIENEVVRQYINKLLKWILVEYQDYSTDGTINSFGAFFILESANELEDYQTMGLSYPITKDSYEWIDNIDDDYCNMCIVLSYDSIITLAHLDVLDKLENINCVCPIQVKEQLLSDINGEISDIKSKHQVGSMSYSNGGLTLFEHNQQSRQARYQFLIKIRIKV